MEAPHGNERSFRIIKCALFTTAVCCDGRLTWSKFDFVDTREFTDNGFGMRMKYVFNPF